jgi:hypothetical protein
MVNNQHKNFSTLDQMNIITHSRNSRARNANPSAQRATRLRSVLARVYAVARQNQITNTVP